jgi:glycosyltransferase involved in cell wall biosynthesis
MKGLFLTLMSIESSPGYSEKIYGQVGAFRKAGIEMDIISFGNDATVTLTKHPNRNSDNAIVLRYFKKKNYWNNRVNAFSAALRFMATEKPEVVYIRHPISDPIYILFLHKLRQLSSSTIVLSEIPTYPYERIHRKDAQGKVLWRVGLEVDRFCQKALKYYIDRIVSIDYCDDIFNIKTISIHNGIDVDAFTLCGNSKSLTSPLRLIGVANLIDYHGYDRIITAIQRQLNLNDMKYNIEFHVVSPPTPILSRLRDEVKIENLSDYVVFHGMKTGKELDDLFDKCHIGVGALAWHRFNITHASNLKSREYMARGIPFLYGGKDKGIPSNYPYALQVPSDETSINLKDILEFAKQIYSSQEHSIAMRDFAKNQWSWSVVMQPVFREIEKMKGNGRNRR